MVVTKDAGVVGEVHAEFIHAPDDPLPDLLDRIGPDLRREVSVEEGVGVARDPAVVGIAGER